MFMYLNQITLFFHKRLGKNYLFPSYSDYKEICNNLTYINFLIVQSLNGKSVGYRMLPHSTNLHENLETLKTVLKITLCDNNH